MAVIGSAIAVLLDGAAELRHRDHRDIFHAIAQVLIKRRQRLAELRQIVGKLSVRWLPADLIDVRVPAADVGERHFHSHIRLDQLRDLLQAFAEAARCRYFAPFAGM